MADYEVGESHFLDIWWRVTVNGAKTLFLGICLGELTNSHVLISPSQDS